MLYSASKYYINVVLYCVSVYYLHIYNFQQQNHTEILRFQQFLRANSAKVRNFSETTKYYSNSKYSRTKCGRSMSFSFLTAIL